MMNFVAVATLSFALGFLAGKSYFSEDKKEVDSYIHKPVFMQRLV